MKNKALQVTYGIHYKRAGNIPASAYVDSSVLKEYAAKPWVPSDKKRAVLDIGCGYGRELYILSELGFTNLTGIEMTKESFEIAEKELKGRAHIIFGDGFRFASRVKGKYDLIILFDVLEHVEKERVVQYLTYLYHALKK
jgi:2-polyprenyl-3-methyl-5-hydroxy-6-metoxy-1,4-benzoquinol methylase